MSEKKIKIEINMILCLALMGLLLSTFLLIRPAVADERGYENVSVQRAKHMIKHTPEIVILDVRNQSEYALGHLDKAACISLNEIENWDWNSTSNSTLPYLNFLETHKNDTVLVYCKAGSRSTIACQELVDNGFSKVYNMEDGILGWMQAGYPIITKYHHVTIDTSSIRADIQIDPWLLYQANCIPCQNSSSCSTSSYSPQLLYENVTIISESETQTILSVSVQVNGTQLQYIINMTILARFTNLNQGINRTASILSTEISEGLNYSKILTLKYHAESNSYNFTLKTNLAPLETQGYNSSLSVISYEPLDRGVIKSKEMVDLNTSTLLSDYYHTIGQTAKKLSKEYNKSADYSIQKLSSSYNIINKELKNLQRIVEENFTQFNLEIPPCSAVMGEGIHVTDPEAINNGSFESGMNYWTSGGLGSHATSQIWYYDGYYSLQLGYHDYYTPNVPIGRDWAYQYISIPYDAIDPQFSFKYLLQTEDSFTYDKFEVYVTPYGGNPVLVFNTGGANRGGYETYGWNTWTTSLEQYIGSSVYIYFAIDSTTDSNYATWVYIDDVHVTYEQLEDCDWDYWLDCAWGDSGTVAGCSNLMAACEAYPIKYVCLAALVCSLGYSVGCAFYCWFWL